MMFQAVASGANCLRAFWPALRGRREGCPDPVTGTPREGRRKKSVSRRTERRVEPMAESCQGAPRPASTTALGHSQACKESCEVQQGWSPPRGAAVDRPADVSGRGRNSDPCQCLHGQRPARPAAGLEDLGRQQDGALWALAPPEGSRGPSPVCAESCRNAQGLPGKQRRAYIDLVYKNLPPELAVYA